MSYKVVKCDDIVCPRTAMASSDYNISYWDTICDPDTHTIVTQNKTTDRIQEKDLTSQAVTGSTTRYLIVGYSDSLGGGEVKLKICTNDIIVKN